MQAQMVWEDRRKRSSQKIAGGGAVRVGDADLPKGQRLPELPLTLPAPAKAATVCFW